MIQLTPEHTIFPPRAPDAPSLWWWRTWLSLVVIILLRRYWWQFHYNTNKKIQIWEEATHEPYTYDNRIEDLQTISTSIRTPDQKARAILVHMFRYYWIQTHEELIPSLTPEELLNITEIKPLLPFFQELYVIIYSGKKITHATIKTFTTNLTWTLSWT